MGRKETVAAPAPAVPVVVSTVDRRNVEVWGEWVATLDGSVNAQIRPRVSGYLISQNYAEGSLLKTGDLLFEIDPRPYIAALDHAKATLARTKAQQIKTQLDVDRLTPLVAKKAVSQQELDDAIGNNDANLAMIKANEADIVDAELNLSFTKVVAPIDGIAGKANAQLGDLVSPSTPTPLTSMSTVDPLTVYAFLTEREYLGAMATLEQIVNVPLEERPESLELVLSDGAAFEHRGRFYFADRQVDAMTGSIRIAARFPNPGNLLRPGQYARLRAVRERIDDAVVVPQRAVMDVQGAFQVALVRPDGTVEIRGIEVGPTVGSEWVVYKGLDGGETIVVEGVQKVREGTKVSMERAPPAGAAAHGPSGMPALKSGPAGSTSNSGAAGTPTARPPAGAGR